MERTMKPDWILLANSSRARLLQRERGIHLTTLESFEHPQGRSKTSELVDDRAGHESNDRSYGGTAYQPRTDAKTKEQQRFAHELAGYLEREAQAGKFRSLEVFASSPFLGALKAELGTATQPLVAAVHDLDLTGLGALELERRLAREAAQ
jgi:protein required for attachment to host cells